MSKSHYIIPIFVPHEGCPHNCVFCNQNSITGSNNVVDAKYADNIIKQYLNTIDHSNSIIEVSFYGGTFTAIDMIKQKELLEVARKYKQLGCIDYIHLSTRPDYIDKKILDNLKYYGVDVIELGVQSLDDEVLKESGRGHSAEDVYNACDLIKEYNFTLGIQVMVGLPGDNFDKDIYTISKVINIHPSLCRIYPSLVIKNTPMEKLFYEGKYRPYSLDKTIDICKKLFGMLVSNNINVMRIGLQPTEEINVGKEVVAGPFHPSIRELIEGSIYNDMLIKNIKNITSSSIEILINPRDISKLYTNKKQYFNELKNCFVNKKIKVNQNFGVKSGSIKLLYDDVSILLSYTDYIHDTYFKIRN